MISILYNTLLESAPYIILGFLIAGIMRFYVPQNILQQHLGTNSAGSLFKSVGVGCVLPLCSCGTIPLGIGLYKSGANTGNMLAFMTSTPILSPVLIMVSLKLLGWKLTLALILTAIIGSVLMGLIGNKLFQKPQKEEACANKSRNYISSRNTRNKTKLFKALNWSFSDLGADVSVDILIGLGIASILLAFLPLEWISTWLGQQEFSTLIYVILLGIPVYACSIPSVVIVQGLLLLGATPGAAIAYMIAGPATNLGELNAIRKSMGTKPATFYAISLIVIALLAGLVTDQFVFPNYQYHAYRVQGELVVQQCCVPLIFGEGVGGPSTFSIPAWHWPFGAILAWVIALGVYKKVRFFFINPCKKCTWKTYGKNEVCGSKCHVRRKYELFRRIS